MKIMMMKGMMMKTMLAKIRMADSVEYRASFKDV